MKASVCIGVFNHSVAVFVNFACHVCVFFTRHFEIIVINKIVACIVRWVNINHFDFAKIAFLQKFQNFQIIPLNIEVFGAVPVYRFLFARAESLADRLVCFNDCLFFANPCKFIGFIALNDFIGKHLFQHIKVDRLFQLAVFVRRFGDTVREQCPDFFDVLSGQVDRLHFYFIHYSYNPSKYLTGAKKHPINYIIFQEKNKEFVCKNKCTFFMRL